MKIIAEYAVYMVLGILLASVGYHVLTWNFWFWMLLMIGCIHLHEWAQKEPQGCATTTTK